MNARLMIKDSAVSAVPGPGVRSEVLAVFDLDGTLVAGDTFLPFLFSYAIGRRRPWPLFVLPMHLALYACRLRSAKATKERLMIALFRDEPMTSIAWHADRFYDHWVRRRLRPGILRLLQEHRDAGHQVILLSASPDLYVRAIARRLGIEHVICTRVAVGDGLCDGRIVGPNCKGEAKVEMLKEALGIERPPSGSYAYGDSQSDLPILEWVEHGYLVSATRRPLRGLSPGDPEISPLPTDPDAVRLRGIWEQAPRPDLIAGRGA